jgi:hypothetical protein
MRAIIIPDDLLVSINGEFVDGVDMSSMPADIHAVQWYETYGEIEYRNSRANEKFDNFEERFGNFINLFDARKIDIKRNSPPNSYLDWDEQTKEWIENANKKAAFDIQEKVDYYKNYLDSTDWYYARLQETGTPVPNDIVASRITARAYIQENS